MMRTGTSTSSQRPEPPRGGRDGDAHRHPSGVDPELKAANLKRLRRIEGQIRGLQRMVEEDRYCPDVMIQLSAAQEALRHVGRALMTNHLRHCVTEALRDGSEARVEATYDELLELIYKHSR